MKQAILIRKDLEMGKGKIAAQASHACVEALLKSHKDNIEKWKKEGMKKIVLEVNDEKELVDYKKKAEDSGLVVGLIRDAGRTQVTAGTLTALAIGPDQDEQIDKITKKLKLL
ncbi:peptidyl-tRNA hydrolase [Candidatus Woesearchaeota archaeon]|nr:peptidyl-tRNA hydrolase [Candidatus Woesearchaeota archaeon]